jgi:hypothetical protein
VGIGLLNNRPSFRPSLAPSLVPSFPSSFPRPHLALVYAPFPPDLHLRALIHSPLKLARPILLLASLALLHFMPLHCNEPAPPTLPLTFNCILAISPHLSFSPSPAASSPVPKSPARPVLILFPSRVSISSSPLLRSISSLLFPAAGIGGTCTPTPPATSCCSPRPTGTPSRACRCVTLE